MVVWYAGDTNSDLINSDECAFCALYQQHSQQIINILIAIARKYWHENNTQSNLKKKRTKMCILNFELDESHHNDAESDKISDPYSV